MHSQVPLGSSLAKAKASSVQEPIATGSDPRVSLCRSDSKRREQNDRPRVAAGCFSGNHYEGF